jgi:hypothetical protein
VLCLNDILKDVSSWFKKVFHRHKWVRVAHWGDKDCSVVVAEFTCGTCGVPMWDLVYFDSDTCKVLKRVSIEDANNTMKSDRRGKFNCDNSCKKTSQSKGKATTKKAKA